MIISLNIPGQPVAKGRGHKIASDDQIIAAYSLHGSCKKAGNSLGMCAQSVHERLVRLGVANSQRILSKEEKNKLLSEYSSHADAGTVSVLAKEMGRSKTFICTHARYLGLTKKSRSRYYLAEKISASAKIRLKIKGHPRGSLGMKHSDETKKKISQASIKWYSSLTEDQKDNRIMKAMKTRSANGTNARIRPETTWKSGWREIGGVNKYYRSKWEANYAYYLEWLKKNGQISDWKHEPETFWFEGIKRGCVSYLPDFRVQLINGEVEYHEVKGWMDDRSKTKIQRMAKYHPKVCLIVIDSKGYSSLKKSVQKLVPGWEQ